MSRKKLRRSRPGRRKREAADQIGALIAAVTEGERVNRDFADWGKQKGASGGADGRRQGEIDAQRRRWRPRAGRSSLKLDEALMRRTRRDMDAQQAALSERRRRRTGGKGAARDRNAHEGSGEPAAGEIHALLAQAKQMEDCLPVLERGRAAESGAGHAEARSSKADGGEAVGRRSPTAAQNSYYLSQAGLLARELKARAALPRVRLDRAPLPAQITRRPSPGRRWSRPQSAARPPKKAQSDAATRLAATEPRWTSRKRPPAGAENQGGRDAGSGWRRASTRRIRRRQTASGR